MVKRLQKPAALPDFRQVVSDALTAAGFTRDDPALEQVRAWNAGAADRQSISVEIRRGQFGKTRKARLDEVDNTTLDNNSTSG